MFSTRSMTLAALLWGLHGVPIALSDASPGTVALLRFALSCVLLVPVLIYLKQKTRTSFALHSTTLLSALFWALNNILFVWAIAQDGGSVSRTVSLSYCFPIFSILFKWWKRGSLSDRDRYCGLLILLGVYCFVPEIGTDELHSAMLAILSGLALAIHLELSQQAHSSTEIVYSVVLGQLVGLLLTLPLVGTHTLTQEVSIFTTNQLLWILALGILTGVTYLVYSLAAPALPSTTTSTILLLEIVVALVAGFLFLGEEVDSTIILGSGIMMTALYVRISEQSAVEPYIQPPPSSTIKRVVQRQNARVPTGTP